MSSTTSDKQPTKTTMKSPTHIPNLPFIRANLCHTLQGHIHLIQDPTTKQPLIIKQTIKKLIQSGIGHAGNKLNENFLEEMRILKYLSNDFNLTKQGICGIFNNYIWEDKYSYYYAMKYCPSDLFEFIRKQFTYFQTNPIMQQTMLKQATHNIPYQPWINIVQLIFKNIVKSVHYLHTKGIAHMDLSLENIMLSGVSNGNIHTQLIDFGIAYDKSQHNNSWISHRRVGKIRYMSPEVAAKGVSYDCRAADIWCLGVILFAMLTGKAPYTKPDIVTDLNDMESDGDIALTYLLNGKIDLILQKQNKRWMVNNDAIDLMKGIFTLERNRISMEEVLSHPFVGLTDRYSFKRENKYKKCEVMNVGL